MSPPAAAGELEIVAEESLLAVLTHKAGLASGLAHNHLVAAGRFEARLEFAAEDPTATVFELRLAVEDLVVDSPSIQAAWAPRLEELGVSDEPFSELSDKDRGKIREAMLGEKQLDAEKHPELSARLLEVKEDPSKLGEVDFPYALRLEVTLQGSPVERSFAGRWEHTPGGLLFEAVGTVPLSSFGIEPYSAMLGAVRNQDEMHLYVHLLARERGAEEAGEGLR